MPEWLKWTCLVACLPAILLLGYGEVKAYASSGPTWLVCSYILLQCGVGLGMLWMVTSWWPEGSDKS